MPELPEVQTVVNHIRPKLIGKKINSINVIWPKVLHNFTTNEADLIVKNKEIKDVYRRAKFIIIQLKKCILAIHLRMTGKLYFHNDSIPKHSTAVFDISNGQKLIFNDVRKFGRIYLFKDLSFINSRHGPEPLKNSFTNALFKSMLESRKRNIKALLLDQSFLSGLGNIYVDESLWRTKIHPNSSSNLIPKKKVYLLRKNIRTILRNAIDKKGTTIINFSINGQSGKYAHDLRVYGRDGKSCKSCESKIIKLKVAGRGTYICNECQKCYRL